MEGMRFTGKKPNSASENQQIDVPKVVDYIALLIHCTRKLLPSAIGIDHFLDTRTVRIQARNYVVVTSLQL